MTQTADQLAKLKPKWSDITEEDAEGVHEITTGTEVAEDGSVIKTSVEYKTNDKGQKVKIIKRVRVHKATIKVNKKVQARKKWKKFGDCAGLPPGPEPGVTSIGDEVEIETTAASGKTELGFKKNTDVTILSVTCRICKGSHWTLKCPYKDKLDLLEKDQGGKGGKEAIGSGSDSLASSSSSIGGGKYRPPGLRSGTGKDEDRRGSSTLTRGGVGGTGGEAENATIRVTNLSEDTKESDISELFRPFGPIQRIYLAKDRISGLSKGFAFVNFVYRKDAAKAIEKLNGHGYDHLILSVEWAKPSNP